MSWQNTHVLTKLASSPLFGRKGVQIWGVDNIAAVVSTVQRGNEAYHGACVWGIKTDFDIVFNEQSKPGAGWSGWSEGSYDRRRGYEITAARQNNQSARVWVITNKQDIISQQVDLTSSWPHWEGYWTNDI